MLIGEQGRPPIIFSLGNEQKKGDATYGIGLWKFYGTFSNLRVIKMSIYVSEIHKIRWSMFFCDSEITFRRNHLARYVRSFGKLQLPTSKQAWARKPNINLPMHQSPVTIRACTRQALSQSECLNNRISANLCRWEALGDRFQRSKVVKVSVEWSSNASTRAFHNYKAWSLPNISHVLPDQGILNFRAASFEQFRNLARRVWGSEIVEWSVGIRPSKKRLVTDIWTACASTHR